MLMRVWLTIGLSASVLTQQQTHTRIQHGDGPSFEWGWQVTPSEDGTPNAQYYVNIPQIYQESANNNTPSQTQYQESQESPSPQPLGIYLLPTQVPLLPGEQTLPQTVHTTIPVQPTEITTQFTSGPQLYDNNYAITPTQYVVHHSIDSNNQNQESNNEYRMNKDQKFSTHLRKEEGDLESNNGSGPTPVVTVFKDHNCHNQDDKQDVNPENINADTRNAFYHNEDTQNGFRQTQTRQSYQIYDKFGHKSDIETPITYKGAVSFRVELPKGNARNERYYYNKEEQPSVRDYSNILTKEQLERLVASTEDLVSNEDLLKINHAEEKQITPDDDQIIKPRPKFRLRSDQTRCYRCKSPTTGQNQISNIVGSKLEHLENDEEKEKILQSNSNYYTFSSPIIVQDSKENNDNIEMVNNLVSTIVPYMEKEYQIFEINNDIRDSYNNNNTNAGEIINITPRPIGQNYLAPITVALRLHNANDSEIFNTEEDHEASDTEIVTDVVNKPEHERTVVEVQESIPLEITHINDAEVHEYLDIGSNTENPLNSAKNLYSKFMEAKTKFHKNMNDLLDKYGNSNHVSNNDEKNYIKNDSKEPLESSENMYTEVEVRPYEDDVNQRIEYIRDYNNGYNREEQYTQNQNIIQPIIVEKEVPITQYVDRYIEKPAPYPKPVEVVKEVPVDRPIVVPVPYEKIVDRPVEVTKYVDKPYPVEVKVPHPYPVEVKVPYPVEQKVYIDRPIHVPYPVERVIEKQFFHTVPVPTPVAVPYEVQIPVEQQVLYPVPVEKPVPIPIEVAKPVPVEKIVEKEIPVPYPVEKHVPYPVHYETKVPIPYPVERKVPVEVEKIVEKPVSVTKYVEKPVRVEVPVPHPVPVHVHIPYPVDRIVEKKVPYPVPVNRYIEKQVQVPYPVETVVEKIIEKPVVVTKYIDKPYPVEKRVPYPVDRVVEKRVPYPVEKIVEKKVPYPVQVPIEVKVPYPVDRIVERPVHVPIKVPYYLGKYANGPRDMYNYGYGHITQQSINIPRYQKYHSDQQKQNAIFNQNHRNYQNSQNQDTAPYQYLKERQQESPYIAIQTTHWGNLYASSYQYVNDTRNGIEYQQFQSTPAINDSTNYAKKQQNNESRYYGPPPMEQSNNVWEQNAEDKRRRTDRTADVSHLKIEYGFKPPLRPSTEIDLEGIPVGNDEK